MKKYLAIVLVALMAVSVLGAVTVVGGTSTVNPSVQPQQNAISQGNLQSINLQPASDPNPPVTNPPVPGSTVQIKLQVSPPVILPQTNQVILVTILYQKNFDPLAYGRETFTFGRTGTEASPVGYYTTDVKGYKDLTLLFNAKNTGLTPLDCRVKLIGTIQEGCVQNPKGPSCFAIAKPITMTGTAPVVVL